MNQNKNRLVAWQKFDGNGFMIGGTNTWRPLGVTPRDGGWVRIPGTLSNLCCGIGDSFLILQNNSSHTNATSLVSADGAIQWTGTIAIGAMQIFVIPNGYDESITLSLSTPTADIDVVASTLIGTGVIVASPSFITSGTNPATSVITTTAQAGCQYLISIIDD